MAFCDFCTCENCQTGVNGYFDLFHAQTTDGRWICDICFAYDQCTSGANRNPKGPCKNNECEHRPRLITKFIK